MGSISIDKLKMKAIALLSRIPDFHETALCVYFGHPLINDGISFIEAKNRFYVFGGYERGRYTETSKTHDVDEALFWVLDAQVEMQSRSKSHELVRYTDSRRLRFEKQDKLFMFIGEPYYSMHKKRISEILKIAPYNDHQTRSLDLVKDFERTSKTLKKLCNTDQKWSDEFEQNVDFFINKSYRGEYQGIFNFKEVFSTMLSKYALIIEELRNKGFFNQQLSVYDDIRIIEEQMSKVDINFIRG